ncbi:hypothetical protein Herbaro_21725 [Herbaspirillum sp. WKF16]|jgi:hypothetical protein|uniref:hypothetical protein n=1 Tax=Herbaspirillum sp. WKF16 TaxID=3028312 RepID=UPI0023A99BCE|nr:hypothetical protein [Herbaspirillum sp. WKF16]WDZ96064.1 hypothetical protein Herbaro_21725 [Herbaspirillum sp. WKF16]
METFNLTHVVIVAAAAAVVVLSAVLHIRLLRKNLARDLRSRIRGWHRGRS